MSGSMGFSLGRLANSLPFSRLFRQLENEVETVARVLQPGPVGIMEHKFSAEEIQKANAVVKMAVKNWRRSARLEQENPFLKDFIDT